MQKELQEFFAGLIELLRANHGNNLSVSMKDHQRRLWVHDGEGVLISQYRDGLGIPANGDENDPVRVEFAARMARVTEENSAYLREIGKTPEDAAAEFRAETERMSGPHQ